MKWVYGLLMMPVVGMALSMWVVPDMVGETTRVILFNSWPALAGLLSTILMVRVAVAFEPGNPSRRVWLWLGLGEGLDALAFAIYGCMEVILGEVPYPSVADLFWVVSYAPWVVAGILAVWHFVGSGLPLRIPWRGVIIGTVLTAGVILWIWLPILQAPETPMLEKLVSGLYPLGDLFLFSGVWVLSLVMAQFGLGSVARPWLLIATGMLVLVFTDTVYVYLEWIGAYKSGMWIDIFWVLSFALVGCGAHMQRGLMQLKRRDV